MNAFMQVGFVKEFMRIHIYVNKNCRIPIESSELKKV